MSRKVVRLNLPELIRQKESRLNLTGRLTQKEIAEAIGVSEHTIARWIRDDVEELNKGLLGRMLTYFDCSISDLLIEETIEDEPSQN